MEDTYVFIDAQYLSLISKHFGSGKPIKYDIFRFAQDLVRRKNLWCNKVFYYTAPPYQSPNPTPEENRRKANYDSFINKVKNNPKFIIKEGRCQKVKGEFKQKGVDTQITMDLCSLQNHNPPKTIVVLLCDTDFVPILNALREQYSKKIILYFFNDYKRGSRFSMSNNILTACDESVLITKDLFDNNKLK